jgi:hypothetical protein
MNAHLVLLPSLPKSATPSVASTVSMGAALEASVSASTTRSPGFITMPTPRVAAGNETAIRVRQLLRWADPSSDVKRLALENQLMALGPEAIPALLDAMVQGNANLQVQALATMAVLRHGKAAHPACQVFCAHYLHHPNPLQPIAQLLCHQLGL